MVKIIIFNLDNTIINYRDKVPRQTYHMFNRFKKLGYIIGIISYYPNGYFLARDINLYKYASFIICEKKLFYLLFEDIYNKIINKFNFNISDIENIYYIDTNNEIINSLTNKYYDKLIGVNFNNVYDVYNLKKMVLL